MMKIFRKNHHGKPRAARSLIGNTANFVFLCLFGAIMVLPMVYAIGNAFKPLDELFLFPPRFIPKNPTFNNFKGIGALFTETMVPFSRYLTNTLWITIFGTAGSIFFASAAGYVLEKKKFPFKKGIFKLITVALLFTGGVTTIPSFLIISKLGVIDTYWSIFLPAFGSSFNVFLMKQFMSNVPNTLLEAARIDGAGEQKIFWTIVMPSVKSAWMTLIIFSFQHLWGQTGGNTIYSEELKTLPYALSQALAAGISRTGESAAISMLMMMVPICVFIITQSNVIETMMSSGIKE
jgi:ABC-type glycerol-3-phosphate transport system permease component